MTPYQRRKLRVENRVLGQVIFHGGFSVFWATESMERARAIERLCKRGVIRPLTGRAAGHFPWCGYELTP